MSLGFPAFMRALARFLLQKPHGEGFSMRVMDGKYITDFLRKRVKNALISKSITASEWVEFYLVNLLLDYQLAEKLHSKDENEDSPLALILLEAWNDKELSKRIILLRDLGDKALYMSGVFNEHIKKKKSVSVEYYKSMGSGAYSSLAEILRGDMLAELYGELSENFQDLALVLGVASMSEGELSATELLKIYKQWLDTGSDRLLLILKKYGIAVDEGGEVH